MSKAGKFDNETAALGRALVGAALGSVPPSAEDRDVLSSQTCFPAASSLRCGLALQTPAAPVAHPAPQACTVSNVLACFSDWPCRMALPVGGEANPFVLVSADLRAPTHPPTYWATSADRSLVGRTLSTGRTAAAEGPR